MRFLFTLTALHAASGAVGFLVADDLPQCYIVHVMQNVVGWLVLEGVEHKKGKETFAVCSWGIEPVHFPSCAAFQMWKPAPGQSSLAQLRVHNRGGENPDASDAPWLTFDWDLQSHEHRMPRTRVNHQL